MNTPKLRGQVTRHNEETKLQGKQGWGQGVRLGWVGLAWVREGHHIYICYAKPILRLAQQNTNEKCV